MRKINLSAAFNPSAYTWNRLAILYVLCLVLPALTIYLLALYTQLFTDIIQLIALLSVSSFVALLFPIVLTIYRIRYETHRSDSNYMHFIELMDNSVDMIFMRDKKGDIIAANQQASEYLEYSKKQLSKMNINQLCANILLEPKTNDTGHQLYETNFSSRTGKTIPVEVRTRHADWFDEQTYVDVIRDISHWQATRDQLEASTRSLETIRNQLETRVQEKSITLEKAVLERIQAQQRFAQIQRLLTSIIDSMPSFIIALDNEYQITEWNRSITEFTRIRPEYARGRRLPELFPEFMSEIELLKRLSKQQPDQVITQRINATYRNQQYILDVMLYPLQKLAQTGSVIRVDNVTDRVQMEDTLVQTEKMLSLGGLAAGMAHEINNPLGALLQSCHNIERRLFGDLPRNKKLLEQHQLDAQALTEYLADQQIDLFIDSIKDSGKRAADIVQDMLTFAKPSARELSEVNLLEAIEHALKLAKRDFKHNPEVNFNRIEIERAYQQQTILIFARQNHLDQVFLNLLLNAAQALASSQSERPKITISVEQQGTEATIKIADNGPGIDAKVLDKIFEPFYSTKTEQRGTGLGLSVSYFIVKEHLSGNMSVSSTLGKGTCIEIRLPVIIKLNQGEVEEDQFELPFKRP
jgi:PAS domain S-box-containing protein